VRKENTVVVVTSLLVEGIMRRRAVAIIAETATIVATIAVAAEATRGLDVTAIARNGDRLALKIALLVEMTADPGTVKIIEVHAIESGVVITDHEIEMLDEYSKKYDSAMDRVLLRSNISTFWNIRSYSVSLSLLNHDSPRDGEQQHMRDAVRH
jgi:hypothetical protein